MAGNPKTPASPPATQSLSKLKSASKSCLVCPFARKSTQTVFGEGPARASIVMVGEQPGDKEDLQGLPFVGPAGTLLDHLLEELGIPRGEVYVTNAVKHFKYERKGKIRLHQKPNAAEVKACRPWLQKELEAIRPAVVLALGSTAAQSVCGRAVKVTKERGVWLTSPITEAKVLASWHPSAILRAIDSHSRAEKRAQLRDDLAKAWKFVKGMRA
jgi:uracil-DNA glycosylase family protein